MEVFQNTTSSLFAVTVPGTHTQQCTLQIRHCYQ